MNVSQGIVVSLILLLTALGTVSALEASMNITITYVANYNPGNVTGEFQPDMTNAIFVGNNSQAIGTGSVVLPLTQNQTRITDVLGVYDVPGLHVQRGHDQLGDYVEFTTYAFNDIDSNEIIKFQVQFDRATIASLVNDTIGPYEFNGDFVCGINETDPSQSNGNDEMTRGADFKSAEFCSMANVHYDRARVYYNVGDLTIPVITNIQVTPRLPFTLFEGNAQQFTINFTSSEYPLRTNFELRNNQGTIVDATPFARVETIFALPLQYTLPSTVDSGTYALTMHVQSGVGEFDTSYSLGTITIEEDDDNKGGRSHRSRIESSDPTPFTTEPRKQPTRTLESEEPVVLESVRESGDYTLSGWLLIGLIIATILVIILIAALLIAR